MNRKLIFALFVFLLAGLLTACNGTVPVTVNPTVVPTADPPTASPSPTDVPTEVPTLEPSPTTVPTEVPLYVGLPADEVEALREQCLQTNPDSLCLPLPTNPTLNGVTVGEEDGSVSIYAPEGSISEIVAPIAGMVEVSRNGEAPNVLLPDRTGALQFRIDGFRFTMDIVRRSPEGVWGFFADSDIESLAQDGQTVGIGDRLVVIRGSYQMWFQGSIDDILRSSFGSVVYVVPAQANADLP